MGPKLFNSKFSKNKAKKDFFLHQNKNGPNYDILTIGGL